MALLKVAAATIVIAVAVVGLMSLANWCLVPVGDAERPTPVRRVLGTVLIGVMAVIIAVGIWFITHDHVARLLGLSG
jgi:hypothetical protein